jgi:hypothetical protein
MNATLAAIGVGWTVTGADGELVAPISDAEGVIDIFSGGYGVIGGVYSGLGNAPARELLS